MLPPKYDVLKELFSVAYKNHAEAIMSKYSVTTDFLKTFLLYKRFFVYFLSKIVLYALYIGTLDLGLN